MEQINVYQEISLCIMLLDCKAFNNNFNFDIINNIDYY